MPEFELLASQIENCFGDLDDEEGLEALLEQLEAYAELAPRILEELHSLASAGNAERCYTMVTQYAHRSPASPAAAVEWVRQLDEQVRRQTA